MVRRKQGNQMQDFFDESIKRTSYKRRWDVAISVKSIVFHHKFITEHSLSPSSALSISVDSNRLCFNFNGSSRNLKQSPSQHHSIIYCRPQITYYNLLQCKCNLTKLQDNMFITDINVM